MGRSALYVILNDRVYIGETVHKGHSFACEHEAIVPKALFDAVQERLAELVPALTNPTSPRIRAFRDLDPRRCGCSRQRSSSSALVPRIRAKRALLARDCRSAQN
ncbi:MAG: recombinase family protein [Rhizomicrobium sp.]